MPLSDNPQPMAPGRETAPPQDEVFAKILKEQQAMANDALSYHEVELERAKRIYETATNALKHLGYLDS